MLRNLGGRRRLGNNEKKAMGDESEKEKHANKLQKRAARRSAKLGTSDHARSSKSASFRLYVLQAHFLTSL